MLPHYSLSVPFCSLHSISSSNQTTILEPPAGKKGKVFNLTAATESQQGTQHLCLRLIVRVLQAAAQMQLPPPAQFTVWTWILNKWYKALTINLHFTFPWTSSTCIFWQYQKRTTHLLFPWPSSISQSTVFYIKRILLSILTTDIFAHIHTRGLMQSFLCHVCPRKDQDIKYVSQVRSSIRTEHWHPLCSKMD